MTPKQRAFAHNYVRTGIIYQSAIDAGYAHNYANSGAIKLLDHPEVIGEIKRLRARMNEQADKNATDVVNEYSKIAFSDRVDFLKEDDFFPDCYMYKSPDELTPDQKAVVERVNSTWRKIDRVVDGVKLSCERQEYSYVLCDKANALQQMGRHFGIFDDKLKLGLAQANPFKDATPQQLEQLRESWVKTMNQPKAIEGDYKEVKA